VVDQPSIDAPPPPPPTDRQTSGPGLRRALGRAGSNSAPAAAAAAARRRWRWPAGRQPLHAGQHRELSRGFIDWQLSRPQVSNLVVVIVAVASPWNDIDG